MEKELLKRLVESIRAIEVANVFNLNRTVEEKEAEYNANPVYKEYCDAFAAAEELLKA